MAQHQRKLLEALFGMTSGDGGSGGGTKKHFSDAAVCKFFLAGLCPHDLFTNTVRRFQRLSIRHSRSETADRR